MVEDVLQRLTGALGNLLEAIPGGARALVAGALVSGLLAGLWTAARRRRAAAAANSRSLLEAQAAQLATMQAVLEARLAEQSRRSDAELAELKGRLAVMADMTSSRQADLARNLDERLDHVTARLGGTLDQVGRQVGQDLNEASRRTSETLTALAGRLAVIDEAQRNMTELSSQVVSLQGVLANKQARGAFGQVRLETIIRDALPASAYEFQPTLSNRRRPDCLIRLPNAPTPLIVDAKFPLEGFEALRLARTTEENKAAARAIREAVGQHIDDIAGKYLIPGETQDTALMFVPSEAVYADLHEEFSDLIQRAHRARIVIVSPNVLMLAVQTMQAVIKDVRVREQAGVIQREVGLLIADVGRLMERMGDVERHFGLAGEALDKVATSVERISARGRRIEALQLEDPPPPAVPDRPPLRATGA